jgi:hypothetical protein
MVSWLLTSEPRFMPKVCGSRQTCACIGTSDSRTSKPRLCHRDILEIWNTQRLTCRQIKQRSSISIFRYTIAMLVPVVRCEVQQNSGHIRKAGRPCSGLELAEEMRICAAGFG